MPTAIYARISRDRDGIRNGVERQEDTCRALCDRNGWDVAQVYVDNDMSAYSLRRPRPEYLQLCDDIKNGLIDRLVVWHPDRLHRSTRELEDFIDVVERAGCEIATVVAGIYDLTTVEGRMLAKVLGAIAQAESEHKSRRITDKHRDLAARGLASGGGIRAYGYRRVLDGAGKITSIEVVPEEAAIIRELMRRFLRGDSLAGMARDLAAREVPTVTGKRWTSATVRGVLHSARIAGQREHNGKITATAPWPAIVSVEDSTKARALLDEASARSTRTPRKYLLTGIVRCSKCDTRLSGGNRRQKPAYACLSGRERAGCGGVSVTAAGLEELVVETVLQAIDTPAFTAILTDVAAGAEVDVADVVVAAQEQLEELATAYGGNVITLSEWLAARKPVEARLEQATRALAQERGMGTISPFVGKPGLLRKQWPTFDVARQSAIIAAVVDRVIVTPKITDGNTFNPARVSIVWRA